MSEKDDGFIRIKRPQGRPSKPFVKPNTSPKTYSFFDEDINEAITNGWTPKEIFKLGILAKKGNPQLIERVRELEESNEKLYKLSQRALKKIEDLGAKLD